MNFPRFMGTKLQQQIQNIARLTITRKAVAESRSHHEA
jgi:hypothetical protein